VASITVVGTASDGTARRCDYAASSTIDTADQELPMQGVVKSYEPGTGDGVVMRETDLSDIDLASDALEGSLFRMLRPGQRVQFDLDANARATRLRLGSEVDMTTPDA
jgi:CspA family cold shock protein